MIVRWIALALILIISSPVYAFTDAYELYIYNRDRHNYYSVRIKNEDTSWTDTKTVEANGCVRFQRIEPGDWSIRIYQDGSMLSDYADFKVKDEDWCIRIRSETGKLYGCNTYYCSP
jgi:hypothetical protein